MAELTKNTPYPMHGQGLQMVVSHACAANTEYFVGMAVMKGATGEAVMPAAGAGAQLLGIVREYKNNLTSGPAGGALAAQEVEVIVKGAVYLPVTKSSGNWARADTNVTVYCTDSGTYTTDAGTNNVSVGKTAKIPEAAIGVALAEVLVLVSGTAARDL